MNISKIIISVLAIVAFMVLENVFMRLRVITADRIGLSYWCFGLSIYDEFRFGID